LLDEVILLPIYPAREVPIPGISSDVLLSRIRKGNKKLVMKEELPGILDKNSLEVLMTLGAGDIDTLAGPIEKYLSE
jgi:UDP-N-acetylmuramate--alanine ligase